MSEVIVCKIDVTKIDKARLFQGKKGTYLDLVLIPTPNSDYGDDYMAVQGVSKEERGSGVRGAILGNAKVLQSRSSEPEEQQPEDEDQRPPDEQGGGSGMVDDSLPFASNVA